MGGRPNAQGHPTRRRHELDRQASPQTQRTQRSYQRRQEIPRSRKRSFVSTRPKVAPGTAHGKHETPSSSDERGKCQKVGNKRRFVEIKNRISVELHFSVLSNI